MKKLLLTAACLLIAAPAFAGVPPIGQPAPDFPDVTGVDSNGKPQQIAAHKGHPVVLEWTNPNCPYVHKMYDTGAMQALQKEETAKGVVWYTISSNAAGGEGYMTPEQANAYIKKAGSAETARILDPKGEIGRLYGATATPDMYVIDDKGVLVYEGAIDDRPTAKHEAVKGAHNYVRAALADLAAGKPVAVSQTQAYGCGIKYAE